MATTLATLKTRLNNLADETIDANKAALWINDAYKDVASRMDWTWLQGLSSFPTVAGDYNYSLAADVAKLTEMKTKDSILAGETVEWLYSDHPEYPTYPDEGDITVKYGSPRHFVPYAGEVWLFPIPDGIYQVNYLYKKNVSDLVNDSDEPLVPEQYREALALGAYMRWLVMDEADQYIINTVQGQFEGIIQKMILEEQSKKTISQPIPWSRREI